MSSPSGLSRFIHGSPADELRAAARSVLPCGAGDLERESGATTVRYVFALIWPQAGIECQAGAAGFRVEIRQFGLHHVVQVPWALVEFDHGLLLVRAIYRAGLPGLLLHAAAALSLAL